MDKISQTHYCFLLDSMSVFVENISIFRRSPKTGSYPLPAFADAYYRKLLIHVIKES